MERGNVEHPRIEWPGGLKVAFARGTLRMEQNTRSIVENGAFPEASEWGYLTSNRQAR